MKTTIAKSTTIRLFLALTGFLLTLVSCRCDLEEDKENSIDQTEKNIVGDSLSLRKN
jgi:hypothetical protein